MNIAIGADHAGFIYKSKLLDFLHQQSHRVKDFGSFSTNSSDYPDFAHPLSLAVSCRDHDLGILLCGSGNGVAMTANKYTGIRAALCWNRELAQLARQHNNANVLCVPVQFVSLQESLQLCDVFMHTPFEGGRHQRRIDKIDIS